MPFVGAVIAAIVAAAQAIASIVASIAAFIGSAIGEAATAVGGLLESVFQSIGDSIGGVLGALFHLSGVVLADIDSTIITTLGVIAKVVTTVDTVVQNIIGPIEQLFQSISGIFDVISKDYQAITTLIDELHADFHNGLQGILQIPQSIADALTSVQANTKQLAELLGQQNADTVSKLLVPGMSFAIGDPLKTIGQQFSYPKSTEFNLFQGLKDQTFGQCGVSNDFVAKFTAIQRALTTPSTTIDYLGKILSDVGWLAIYLEAAVVADIECIKQGARKGNPSSLLGVGDVLEALYRGIISESQAQDEVTRSGLSESRFQTLKENAQWLPGIREALIYFWRGVISHDELVQLLGKLHLTTTDAAALEEATPEPVNPRETIAVWGRKIASENSFLGVSLQSPPPDEVQKQYLPLGLHPERAQFDWDAHWDIPALDWWLTAYVRGLISENDYKNAAVAKNIPEELHDKLLPIYQETIQLWMVPDILATGMLTEQQALDYLAYIGVGPKDAQLLVQWGLTKAQLPLSVQAQQLKAISLGNAREMYVDKIIDKATYIEILEAHQYTSQAAILTVDLEDQTQAIAARKQYVTDLLNQVDLGLITPQQLTDEMTKQGYSQSEILAAFEKIKSSAIAKTKTPTKSEYTDFLKYGVIDGDTFILALINMGYSPADAVNFYNLEVKQYGEPAQPATASTISAR